MIIFDYRLYLIIDYILNLYFIFFQPEYGVNDLINLQIHCMPESTEHKNAKQLVLNHLSEGGSIQIRTCCRYCGSVGSHQTQVISKEDGGSIIEEGELELINTDGNSQTFRGDVVLVNPQKTIVIEVCHTHASSHQKTKTLHN